VRIEIFSTGIILGIKLIKMYEEQGDLRNNYKAFKLYIFSISTKSC